MPITQKDIAERVGVSREAVKFALNGNGRVSDSTRQRIMEAAAEMGYHPHSNQAARQMAARRNRTQARHGVLAVLFPASEDGPSIRNMPFFMPILEGVERESHERHVDVAMYSFRTSGLPRAIREREVDGVICISPEPEQIESLHELNLPVVTLSGYFSSVHSLLPDDREGFRLSTEHLIRLGHRRIGYLGFPPKFESATQRLAGYKQALKAAGIPLEEVLIEDSLKDVEMSAGREAVDRLLARTGDFTALVCHNDLIAMGACCRLEEAGRRVPQDVSIVGFDDISCEYGFRPAITSVRSDRAAAGKCAVDLLLHNRENVGDENAPRSIQHMVFPVELVVRESSAPV